MPPIPYARPGEKQPFNWKRWLIISVVFGLIGVNKQRLIDLVKTYAAPGILGLDKKLSDVLIENLMYIGNCSIMIYSMNQMCRGRECLYGLGSSAVLR